MLDQCCAQHQRYFWAGVVQKVGDDEVHALHVAQNALVLQGQYLQQLLELFTTFLSLAKEKVGRKCAVKVFVNLYDLGVSQVVLDS